MQLQSESGIWADADARVFSILMGGNRTERRMMAANRTVQNAIRRVASLRRFRQAIDAHEHRVAEREIAREFAPSWGRSIVARMPRSDAVSRSNRSKRSALSARTSNRAIRAYKTPLLDARGRVALYFRVRYLGLKSKGWRLGLAGEHVDYLFRAEALEHGGVATDKCLSNMGETPAEIAACWDLLEAVEQGYRANAKVQYRIIWNLPHNLTAEQRREMVETFCEREFGRLGLPWVAAIHEPDERGDQRNYHAHICFSIRPCERTGDHAWSIAQEKVNGLTDEHGLKVMRAIAAAHMNHACHQADIPDRYTHQTYKDRGLDAVRQAHIGPAAMAAHEKGEAVGVIERNATIVDRNETAYERDHVRRALVATEQMVAFAARRVDLAMMRAAIALKLSRARAIANGARLVIQERAVRPFIEGRRDAVARLSQRAGAVGRTLAAQVPDHRVEWEARRRTLADVIDRGQRIARQRSERDQHQASILSSRSVLPALMARIETQKVERAKTVILTSPSKPYTMSGTILTLDLSAMTEPDRVLVHALQRDILTDVLLERHARDQYRAAAEKRERQQAEERQRVADLQRRTLTQEASRIILETPSRPYQRDGAILRLDGSALTDAERNVISSVDRDDQEIVATLRIRVERDRVDDAVEAMYRAVAEERILFVLDGDDNRVVDDAIRRRFDLSVEVIGRTDVQDRLDTIAARQADELTPLIDHIAAHPDQIVRRADSWSLTESAPVALMRTAEAWRHDPRLNAYLLKAAMVVAETSTAIAPSITEAKPTPASPTRGQLLILAAQQRRLLTHAWVQSRRLDTATTSGVDPVGVAVNSTSAEPPFAAGRMAQQARDHGR